VPSVQLRCVVCGFLALLPSVGVAWDTGWTGVKLVSDGVCPACVADLDPQAEPIHNPSDGTELSPRTLWTFAREFSPLGSAGRLS
jgi:hypothetical protein